MSFQTRHREREDSTVANISTTTHFFKYHCQTRERERMWLLRKSVQIHKTIKYHYQTLQQLPEEEKEGRGEENISFQWTKHINNTSYHKKRQTVSPYKTIKRNLFLNMHRSPLLPGKYNVTKDSAVKQALLRDNVSKITTKTILVACTIIIIYTTCYLAH